ncbi:putative tetratricopeptide-like helical domain, DYW domain-containing protein [Heracleum sosnowskyi]|uniref:Tetratricopeptide-like helical domain, DYW domain-containing protein n=1 Tax=Heracleum sosnowskyi TaxID=360622 RepID=A0AAD8MS93_9APIA|nr:putative tetratricopeptide-like helical domain, DYW domain-containing protein [Heracleum sosnowskyi]
MLSIYKTLPHFLLTPSTYTYKKQSHKHKNESPINKPIKKISPLSRTKSSCTNIYATLSLSRTKNHQDFDYNVEILKACEMGNLKEAMRLFSHPEKSSLDSKTCCAILQLCGEFKALSDGKKVHDFVSGIGGEIDEFVCAKLVFMYVNCGDLDQGRRVFDTIENEKVFLWNLLISEYSKIGEFEESVCLFMRMRGLGVEANEFTFSCVLKCFGALGRVVDGERVHGYLSKIGFGSNNIVVNALIGFYFRCKRTDSARKLFDGLADRDEITWNSMVSGYVANGLARNALRVFVEMLSESVSVELAVMINVLVAIGSLERLDLARAVHGFGVKGCFCSETNFANTLLDVYSKCGDMDGSVKIFRNMGRKSVVTYTALISGYAREGLFTEAIKLFDDMKRDGIKPDVFTVTSILHACACNGSLEKGKEVHSYIRDSNMQLSLFASNALIDMYAKCGSMEDALAVFYEMPRTDIVSWNTMIGGYSKNRLPNEALNFFVKMQNDLKPDNVTISCILPSCGNLSALDRGREIHSFVLKNGLSSDLFVMNGLLDMYVKCGALVLARSLFSIMPEKNLVSWTVMTAGYGMHGFGRQAVSTFSEMRRAGIKPDHASFLSILYACSHSGLLDEGWSLFNIMQNNCKIEPTLEHYTCMVDLLSRAKKLSRAYSLIKNMPIEADCFIWGVLLRGCRIHHDLKLAEKVAEHIFDLEPDNTEYYVLLANSYAEAEQWEEVKKLKQKIGLHGPKKERDCSWIQMKDKVHIFVAGDDAHPLTKDINLLLKKLQKDMKEQGDSLNMRYVLINTDEMQKEEAHCGHSEKLAMAFGILRLPPGKIIRVTKNLRVCSDCHETAKYISKVIGREIVLRDSRRFHHFKEGCCSCRG